MLHTRIRPAGAAIFAAACLLLPGVGRPDDQPLAKDRESARKEWEANLASRPPEELLVAIDSLAQEWAARKGAYEVAHHQFTAQAAEVGKSRQRLADLKQPAATIPLVLRAADIEVAIKAAQGLAEFHATRAQHIEALKAALATLAVRGAAFDHAATAADDHLFKMRTAVELAAKTGLSDKLPEPLGKKQLDAAATRLKTLTAEVRAETQKAKTDLAPLEKELAAAKAASEAATVKLNELKSAQADTLAAFKFEEQAKGMSAAQLTDEFTKLHKSLAEKLAASDGDTRDYTKAVAATAEVRAKFDAVKEPVPPAGEPLASLASLEQAARGLTAAQQQLATRVRVMTEREEKAVALVAALDELEKKAVAYSTTLEDSRQLATQVSALAAEIERRVGRGDLEPGKVPDGLAITGRAKIEKDTADVLVTLQKLRQERDALRKPDAERDNLKSLTRELLAHVNARIDLLTDLKKLAADYVTARKDRPDAEQKRMDQHAAERMTRDAPQWDSLLALDPSKPSGDASELVAAYYKELVDLDEKNENLKRQRETIDRLVELTRKEAADVAKLRTVLEKRVAESEGVRKWDEWLQSRLASPGLKAEADVYHDETARLNAVAGANARRVAALTGNPPQEAGKTAEQSKLPANGGEIGKARDELQSARVRGLRTTSIKIGIILLAALLIPRIVMFILRRAIRGGTDEAGNPSPVLAALRGVLKAGVWIAAIALVLSTLGYDVTALVIALAIGVLAIALAARPMIADVLGSVVIFAERRFKVGDVVRLGTGEPARVVDLTWRSTALKNTNGLVVSVPNRKVTETTVENLSRAGETYDAIAVTVSTDKDAGKVIAVIRAAVTQCKNVAPDNGVTVVKYNQKGTVKVVEYRFWWFLKDYEARNKTRDEVFARIAMGLSHEDMTGIELTLA